MKYCSFHRCVHYNMRRKAGWASLRTHPAFLNGNCFYEGFTCPSTKLDRIPESRLLSDHFHQRSSLIINIDHMMLIILHVTRDTIPVFNIHNIVHRPRALAYRAFFDLLGNTPFILCFDTFLSREMNLESGKPRSHGLWRNIPFFSNPVNRSSLFQESGESIPIRDLIRSLHRYRHQPFSLSVTVRDPISARHISPIDIVRRASDPAGAALQAILERNSRLLLFLIPFVDVGRADKGTASRRAFLAKSRILEFQMRSFIAFVAYGKQSIRNSLLAHPLVALHPLIPSFIRLSVPPAASFTSRMACFCFSAFVTPSTENMLKAA